ncbi:MAG: tRNA lysidine(34) synthetase TilS [Bacteroidia bacterium]|nr:tRNA lysidine(34) synthetase TilS [Bacteroidia bacterium]GIV23562.1 MAG: hypothetical protein KatS3mg025_1221 [Bacteroidia bacterium]
MAFSGGPDSVSLACILRDLGYPVALAYVNHNLRGAASIAEEAWIADFAERQGFPLFVRRIQPEEWINSTRGLQATARRLRYEWMEALAKERGFPWIATAHTQEDLVETLLYRWTRSTSPYLLQGIPYRRGRWIRPLLYTSRRDLLRYLRENGLPFLLDTSNYTPRYLRNQIRWWALPPLYRINPSLAARWTERLQLYRMERKRLHKLYRRWVARWLTPKPYGLLASGPAPKDAFFFWAICQQRLSWPEAQALWRLWKTASSGAFFHHQGTLYVRVPQGLQIGDASLWETEWPPLLIPPDGGRWTWGLWHIEAGRGHPSAPGFILIWDYAKLSFPLRLRQWRRGDRIRPHGLHSHSRKVSDIWPEIDLYGFERKHALVVENAEGILIGAIGYRVAEGLAPTVPDTEIFYLRAQYGEYPPH